ncbi:mechanosensitive ion channel family protein [Pseudolabrys sp. FHR47]|uniref:mechanosensitive ion channel family protein n=1 Tax=Pseudolabrys sp. FHR47 TaxID=2562284 RepID=UPI0010BF4301|nr:mechanosensitive ion channel domain-containing protein [Pseudolabrys sp. FHR47]
MDGVQSGIASLADTLPKLVAELSSFWLLVQFGILLAAGAIGTVAGILIRRRVDLTSVTMGWPPMLKLLARSFLECVGTIIFIVILFIVREAMLSLTWPSRSYLLGVAVSLATAWVVIALVTSLIRNQFIHRVVSIGAWTFAALDILGLRMAVRAELDSYALVVGGLRISALTVIKGTVLLLFTLWIANAFSDFVDRRLRTVNDLTPSVQVLISKVLRILLITFAIFIVLSSVGIDLSALAFFSGAIGLGVGFGLQKIVSNLVSGIILLADKSIKPGDVVTIGDQVGWVTNMGARYTSVDTRDGREILIPNEDFVTQQVINWSYSDNRMMLKSLFGVSYDSNPHHVREVAVAAALKVPRVLHDPAPVCYFEEFGDSSLNFSLRYWIADPNNGIINVRAPVMLALWDAFKEAGIEIPYPVRDVRITREAPMRGKTGLEPPGD